MDPWRCKLEIACKWSEICQYYLNIMELSCSTFQKEERKCTWVKYFIYAVLSQFQIRRNLRVFMCQNSEFTKKLFFSSLPGLSTFPLKIKTFDTDFITRTSKIGSEFSVPSSWYIIWFPPPLSIMAFRRWFVKISSDFKYTRQDTKFLRL